MLPTLASRWRTASEAKVGRATIRRDLAVLGWSCRKVWSPLRLMMVPARRMEGTGDVDVAAADGQHFADPGGGAEHDLDDSAELAVGLGTGDVAGGALRPSMSEGWTSPSPTPKVCRATLTGAINQAQVRASFGSESEFER
jgi:hypothetical protein